MSNGLTELFDQSPVPMARIMPNGTIRQANTALGELLGFSAQELTNFELPNLLNGHDVPTFNGELEKTWDTKTGFTIRVRFVTKDGVEIWTQLYAIPIVSTSENVAQEVEHVVSWIMPLRTPNAVVERQTKNGKKEFIPAANLVDVAWATFLRNPRLSVAAALAFLLLSGVLSDTTVAMVVSLLKQLIDIP